MTKKEIIEETVAYYGENERALSEEGTCHYLIDNKMCAVGRCLTPAALEKWGSLKGSVSTLRDELRISGETFENTLQDQYKGHSIDFWNQLQQLHDVDENWCNGKLTDSGERVVEYMIKRWCNEDGSDKKV